MSKVPYLDSLFPLCALYLAMDVWSAKGYAKSLLNREFRPIFLFASAVPCLGRLCFSANSVLNPVKPKEVTPRGGQAALQDAVVT